MTRVGDVGHCVEGALCVIWHLRVPPPLGGRRVASGVHPGATSVWRLGRAALTVLLSTMRYVALDRYISNCDMARSRGPSLSGTVWAATCWASRGWSRRLA